MIISTIQELFDLCKNGCIIHKKYLQALHNIYKSQTLQDFIEEYMRCIVVAFQTDITSKCANILLTFASSFCIEIVTEYELQMNENSSDEYEPHPFFLQLVNRTLKYVHVANANVRYHACQFLRMILSNFTGDIFISDMICDKIQTVLLARLVDPKPQIRCEAIKTLMRLQDPHNPNCPVIEGFINTLADPVCSVRKHVIENIAPCMCTYKHIITRLRDVDPSTRATAFTKLSKLHPKLLSIVYRQNIIMGGLLEVNAVPKRMFEELLLPKWLKIYNSNVLEFMSALKLDANEEDVEQTEKIYERILPIIFSLLTFEELVSLLELDDSKRVPIDALTLEKTTFWCFLVEYISKLKDTETELEAIISPLTDFVAYIESYLKYKSETNMEHWEYLEYQQILQKLFKMLMKLDISDEFGRQAMWKLIVSVLTNVKLEQSVIGAVIKAFHALEPDANKLAYELCTIVGDIKEPFQEAVVPVEVRRAREIQVAQLKVKLHILNDEVKSAVDKNEYESIDKLSKEGEVLRKRLKEAEEILNEEPPPVRSVRTDMDTICRCMNIMIAFIENIRFEEIPNSLRTFKSECFTHEEIDPLYPGAYPKIFRLTCLYSIIDKEIAIQNLETIYTPILAYRVAAMHEENILQIAVAAVSDLMRVHGPDLFDGVSIPQTNKNNKERKRGNDRTLYSENGNDSDSEVHSLASIANLSSNAIIDIMLNMLDDNLPEIRSSAAVAIAKLVVKGICVNPSLITRLLLKWFNPTLDTDDKHDQKVQRYIGTALTRYFHDIRGSLEMLEKAIIPTLCCIGNAPNTSPLAEIEYDNVLECLTTFTKIKENETTIIHKSLAYSILSKISKSKDPAVRVLAKMLLYLELPRDEPNIIKELSQLVETAEDNIGDKMTLTSLKKFSNKLNGTNDSRNTINATKDATRTSETPTKGRKRRTLMNVSELPAIQEQASDITNETIGTPAATSRRGRSRSNGIVNNTPSALEELNDNSNDCPESPAKIRKQNSSIDSNGDDTLHTIHELTVNGLENLVINDGSCTPVTPSNNQRRLRASTTSSIENKNGKVNKTSTPSPRRGRSYKPSIEPGLETIDEVSKKNSSNDSYNIETPSTTSSESSVSSTRGERKTIEEEHITSVKRRKARGQKKNGQNEEVKRTPNTSRRVTRLSSRTSSEDENVLLTESSSDSETAPKRKSPRNK